VFLHPSISPPVSPASLHLSCNPLSCRTPRPLTATVRRTAASPSGLVIRPRSQAEQFQNGASETSGMWVVLDLQSQLTDND